MEEVVSGQFQVRFLRARFRALPGLVLLCKSLKAAESAVPYRDDWKAAADGAAGAYRDEAKAAAAASFAAAGAYRED